MNLKHIVASYLSNIEEFLNVKKPLVAVLTYHSISSEGSVVSVSPSVFAQHIDYLVKNEYEFITASDVIDYTKGVKSINKHSVAITFDDGYESVYQNAYPILESQSIPATVFTLSEPHRADRNELENALPLMNESQLKVLANCGWEIAGHTATHSDLLQVNAKLNYEIVESKRKLESSIDKPITSFAYPKGKYNKRLERYVKKAGYRGAFIVESGVITPSTGQFKIPRIGVDRSHLEGDIKHFTKYWFLLYGKLTKKLPRYRKPIANELYYPGAQNI